MYEHQVSKKSSSNITNSSEQQQARSLGAKAQQATPRTILQLQRTIGNQATLEFLRKNSGLWVQAKLRIGKPGDEYEQIADETANQVVEYINASENASARQESPPEKPRMQPGSGQVQRQEDEEELQMQSEYGVAQRQEDEEELQMQPESGVAQRQETDAWGIAKPGIEMAIQQARGGGQNIESHLQRKMGNAFGTSFRDVKIHTDTRSDLLNRSLGARAFTTGKDIFFRQGEYNPGSSSGQKLLAHELTHVVQQSDAVQRQEGACG